MTLHDAVRLHRAYYYCETCKQGFCPLDQVLHLGTGEYSARVAGLISRFSSYLPFRQGMRELEAVCHIRVSVPTAQRKTELVGRQLQQEWEQQEAAFFADPDREAVAHPTQLHLTLDGVMVHVDGEWKEAKVGCAYERGGEKTLASASYVATLAPSAAFGKRWRTLAHRCGADNCRKTGIVADGAEWIWQETGRYFPTQVQILDFYHACEHLAEVGRVRFGDGSLEAKTWLSAQKERLLADKIGDVIDAVWAGPPGNASAGEVQRKAGNYLRTHQQRMRYQTFQAAGWHIGSGVAEAGCKQVVQARMKQAGMRWKRPGAEAMLHLRAACCSTKPPNYRKLAQRALAA